MTEREHQSSFFSDPDSLELIIPSENAADEAQDDQNQLLVEGVSVNVIDRWEGMLRLLDTSAQMAQRQRLGGLRHQTRTPDGKEKHWKEWRARMEKLNVLERTRVDYERYLKNSENKFHSLRDEMLGEVAVFLASDQMIASGYADEDTMKMNAEMALYDLREAVYLAPEKRKKMIANAKSGLIHFSPREEE